MLIAQSSDKSSDSQTYIQTTQSSYVAISEEDIEKEKEKRENINYQQIADMYNDTCVSFPRLTVLFG